MSQFREEIGAQPAVAARLLERAWPVAQQIGVAVRAADPIGIMVAARGSSDHAAIYAKYLFQHRNRLPVALAAPSLFTHYRTPPRLERFCVIGISQSGASLDVAAVIQEARRQGALTVALSNTAGSDLAASAGFAIDFEAGEENSVPASKTYTASLLAIALLSAAMDPEVDFEAALRRVPDALGRALAAEDQAAGVAASITGDRLIVLGRGFNLATAEELALKLTETSYLLARAWSAADFLHGPIALLEPEFPVVLVESTGPMFSEARRLVDRLATSGCRVLQVADGTDPLPSAYAAIRIESGLPETLTPLPLAVASQLFANQLALARGHDPDHPRALRKVTQTW